MKNAAIDHFLPKTGVKEAVFVSIFEYFKIEKFKKL